jgi:hypothetical protein
MKSQVTQTTVAGKLVNPRSPHARGAAGITVSLIILTSLLATLVFAPSAMASFGVEHFAIAATNQRTPEQEAKGEPASLDVQAGSHPYALTTTFVLNQPKLTTIEEPGGEERKEFLAQGDLKDVALELPPGFVGDPEATPRCGYQAFVTGTCSNEAVVGVSTTYFTETKDNLVIIDETNPVYNLEPPSGIAAEFGFVVAGSTPVFLNSSVRTGGDYGLTVRSSDIDEGLALYASKVTIWGVPADPRHDDVRGSCVGHTEELIEETETYGLGEGEDEQENPLGRPNEGKIPGTGINETYECPVNTPELPLLTNPTSCGIPRTATLSMDSWEEPGIFDSRSASLPEISGCEKLDFSPTVDVTPDGTESSTPTGLNVDVHVPQASTSNPVGLAEADVRDTTVTLPAGVQLSPSAADGLQACAQLHGGEPQKEAAEEKHEVSGINLETKQPANCPDASKVANVKIATPLLEHELAGSVYLAAPQNFAGLPENPFSSLVALYLVAEEPEAGVLIKIAGRVTPNPETGQLTATFENTPQLPFSDLKLEFYGTDRAPLATPALCGTYRTEASFTPWSGTPAVSPTTSFQITSGPGGSPCSDPLPFAPSLESGMTNISAGSFSNLTTTLSREDGQQSLQSVTLHYPAGVSGILAGVPLCGEAQANAGTCGETSRIGETIVSVGLGNDPFNVTGGKVYLTGPYEGAPFGLSIVNPAKAGPFDLQEGRPVVVRAKIEVNPTTAALTVTTNTAAEGYAIPTIIDGIPLQIKHVNVNITRPGFTFNPTSCNPMQVTGTMNSAEGASSPVSVPFQVTNCASLKFEPRFTASTSGTTSRADGASLTLKVTQPNGPTSGRANFALAKIELPEQLPSRLTTLQKACAAATFEANPAACPAASDIGHVKVTTPLLPVPLEGPAYFVSHGGEAFPSVIFVLQGYGVTIDVVSTTFISKSGITSATLKTVPDAPFTSFELTFPEKRYSALAAVGNLCKDAGKLTMPTEFIAQNGLQFHQSTPISVTGCAKKAKSLTRAQRLQKALKACARDKGKRAECMKQADTRYGGKRKKRRT